MMLVSDTLELKLKKWEEIVVNISTVNTLKNSVIYINIL